MKKFHTCPYHLYCRRSMCVLIDSQEFFPVEEYHKKENKRLSVNFHGFVKDLNGVLSKMKVMIAPVFAGTGISTKNMQALGL